MCPKCAPCLRPALCYGDSAFAECLREFFASESMVLEFWIKVLRSTSCMQCFCTLCNDMLIWYVDRPSYIATLAMVVCVLLTLLLYLLCTWLADLVCRARFTNRA